MDGLGVVRAAAARAAAAAAAAAVGVLEASDSPHSTVMLAER